MSGNGISDINENVNKTPDALCFNIWRMALINKVK
jgi:hypothetical protein